MEMDVQRLLYEKKTTAEIKLIYVFVYNLQYCFQMQTNIINKYISTLNNFQESHKINITKITT